MLHLHLPLGISVDLSVYPNGAKFFLYPLKMEIWVLYANNDSWNTASITGGALYGD